MNEHSPLGANLQRQRRAQAMTQQMLAEKSGVSVTTISRLETQYRGFVRASTGSRLAAALGVQPSTLYGVATSDPEMVEHDIEPLRRVVNTLGLPGVGAELPDILPMAKLRADEQRAWNAYIVGRHAELLTILPPLVVDGERTVRESSGQARAEAHRILSFALCLSAGLAGRLGQLDLATHAAHRAIDAARQTAAADLHVAIATRYLIWVLIRQGATADAQHIAVATAEHIEPGMLHADYAKIAVFGNLLFNAATAAALNHRKSAAEDLINTANSAAVRIGADCVTESGIFGSRSAAIQHVEHAVRIGEYDRALQLSDRVAHTPGTVPPFWEAGHRIHIAAVAMQHGQPDHALTSLQEARDLSPDWARLQPLAISVTHSLINSYPNRLRSGLHQLAAHYGVTP